MASIITVRTAAPEPEQFPVIAFRNGANGRPMYVSHLPGDGGVDWGYTHRIQGNIWQGKVFDPALPLSRWHWQRFATAHRDARWYGAAGISGDRK